MSRRKIINGLILLFVVWVILLIFDVPGFLASLIYDDQSISNMLLNMGIKGKIFFVVLFILIVYGVVVFLNHKKYNNFLDKLAKRFSLEKGEYVFDANAYDDYSGVGKNTFKAIGGIYEKYFVTIGRSSMRLSSDSMTGNYHVVVLPQTASIEHKKVVYEVNQIKEQLSWISMMQSQSDILMKYNDYRKIKGKKVAGGKEMAENIDKVGLERRSTYVFENGVVVFFTEKDSPEDVGSKLEGAINLMLVLQK